MELTTILLRDFKKVARVEIQLADLNVMVGGNNCGKSSVLQGIHFSIAAAIAARSAGKSTFPQDALLYCPARQFEYLRHGSQYSNQQHFSYLELKARFPDDPVEQSHQIKIYRGRNEGNVGCVRSGFPRLGSMVSNPDSLFSIYVPGLAGVPQVEQFRSESVVRRGVASGDANLYLRNVLLIIENKKQMPALMAYMRLLFPQFHLYVKFDPKSDIYIDVFVSITGAAGRKTQLEMVGTGILQALQIFAYVTLFAPKLLLLDEPDSHLHPDNQSLLASALKVVAQVTSTKVIVSTHSRHMVDALHDDSNFVWLKDGRVMEQGVAPDILPMLLDLGAIDSYDRLRGGGIKTVFLTEDSNMQLLRILSAASGFVEAETLYFSYRTSSRLDSALILAEFIKAEAPNTEIIIHRDRDFMTNDEVTSVNQKIAGVGAHPFVTEGADIESYFVDAEHIAEIMHLEVPIIATWLNEIAQVEHNAFVTAFLRKRDEVVNNLYRQNRDAAPSSADLLGDAIPLPVEKRRGKDMLKSIRRILAASNDPEHKKINLLVPGPKLRSAILQGYALVM